MGRRRQTQPHPDCPTFPSSNEHLDLSWHEAVVKKDLSCLLLAEKEKQHFKAWQHCS